jgi:hypothetical protein
VSHGRIVHAILKNEGIPASAKPMQTCRDRDWAGVGMVAKPGADFLDAGPDVSRVGKSIARQIDLIDIQRTAIDKRTE